MGSAIDVGDASGALVQARSEARAGLDQSQGNSPSIADTLSAIPNVTVRPRPSSPARYQPSPIHEPSDADTLTGQQGDGSDLQIPSDTETAIKPPSAAVTASEDNGEYSAKSLLHFIRDSVHGTGKELVDLAPRVAFGLGGLVTQAGAGVLAMGDATVDRWNDQYDRLTGKQTSGQSRHVDNADSRMADTFFDFKKNYIDKAIADWTPERAKYTGQGDGSGGLAQAIGGGLEALPFMVAGPAGIPAMIGKAISDSATNEIDEGHSVSTAIANGVIDGLVNYVQVKWGVIPTLPLVKRIGAAIGAGELARMTGEVAKMGVQAATGAPVNNPFTNYDLPKAAEQAVQNAIFGIFGGHKAAKADTGLVPPPSGAATPPSGGGPGATPPSGGPSAPSPESAAPADSGAGLPPASLGAGLPPASPPNVLAPGTIPSILPPTPADTGTAPTTSGAGLPPASLGAGLPPASLGAGLPPASPASTVPDHPTAESGVQLAAQIKDMNNKDTPRQGVFVSIASLNRSGTTRDATLQGVGNTLAQAEKQGRTIQLPNGTLLIKTKAQAADAKAQLDKGVDPQYVIGMITGSGGGKAPDQTAVVQGKDAGGNVAVETAVTPADVPLAAQKIVDEGKTPVVTTPAAAVAARAADVAREDAAPAQPGVMTTPGGKQVAVHIEPGAPAGFTRVRALDVNGDPGDHAVDVPQGRVKLNVPGAKPEPAAPSTPKPATPTEPESVAPAEKLPEDIAAAAKPADEAPPAAPVDKAVTGEAPPAAPKPAVKVSVRTKGGKVVKQPDAAQPKSAVADDRPSSNDVRKANDAKLAKERAERGGVSKKEGEVQAKHSPEHQADLDAVGKVLSHEISGEDEDEVRAVHARLRDIVGKDMPSLRSIFDEGRDEDDVAPQLRRAAELALVKKHADKPAEKPTENLPKKSAESVPAETVAAEKAAPLKAKRPDTPIDTLTKALAMHEAQEAESGEDSKLPARQENMRTFAQALHAAIKGLTGKVSVSDLERATKIAKVVGGFANSKGNTVEGMGTKSKEDTVKNRGIGHVEVSTVNDEMHRVARILLDQAKPGDEVSLMSDKGSITAAVTKAKVASNRKKPDKVVVPGVEAPTDAQIKAVKAEKAKAIAAEKKARAEAKAKAEAEKVQIEFKPEHAGDLRKPAPAKGTVEATALEKKANRLEHEYMTAENGPEAESARLALEQHIHEMHPEFTPQQRDTILQLLDQQRLRDNPEAAAGLGRMSDTVEDETSKLDEKDMLGGAKTGFRRGGTELLNDIKNKIFGNKMHQQWDRLASQINLKRLLGEADSGIGLSSHTLLNRLLAKVDQPELKTILESLRRNVPDVPVHSVSTVTNLYQNYKYNDRVKGSYNQLYRTVQVRADRHPVLELKTLVHELFHAATGHEIDKNPKGPLALSLERARLVLHNRLVARRNEEFRAWQAGDADARQSEQHMYGITNNHEMLAEIFTNPEFMRLVAESEKWAQPYEEFAWKRQFGNSEEGNANVPFSSTDQTLLGKLLSSIGKFFGITDPKLMRHIAGLGEQVMKAQHAGINDLGGRHSDLRGSVDTLHAKTATELIARFGANPLEAKKAAPGIAKLSEPLKPNKKLMEATGETQNQDRPDPYKTQPILQDLRDWYAHKADLMADTPASSWTDADRAKLAEVKARIERIEQGAEPDLLRQPPRSKVLEIYDKYVAGGGDSSDIHTLSEAWGHNRHEAHLMGRAVRQHTVDLAEGRTGSEHLNVGQSADDNPITREAAIFARANTAAKAGAATATHAARVAVDWVKSIDQIIRDHRSDFGHPDDPHNPMNAYEDAKDASTKVQRAFHEITRPVAEAWNKLPKDVEFRMSELMQDTTQWQLDPRKDFAKNSAESQQGYQAEWRHKNFQERLAALPPDAQKVFSDAFDATKAVNQKVRQGNIDVALQTFHDDPGSITDAQRILAYGVHNRADLDVLVRPGGLIDVGDGNSKLRDALDPYTRSNYIQGPYMHLGREGDFVVHANKEGTQKFDTKAQAVKFEGFVNNLSPASQGTYRLIGGEHTVDYKADYTAFHKNTAEAEADRDRITTAGLEPGNVTRKSETAQQTASMAGMRGMLAAAKTRLEKGAGKDNKGTQALVQALESAFQQAQAARNAFMGSRLARTSAAGMKPGEMRKNFSEYAVSAAWHTAQMKTLFAQSNALKGLQSAARERDLSISQQTAYRRGSAVNILGRHMLQETTDYGDEHMVNKFMAKLGFMSYLASPSHAVIWSTQNFTTGIPRGAALYGHNNSVKAFFRGMHTVAMPVLRAGVLNAMKRGGNSHDIHDAVVAILKEHKFYGQYVKGENSPFQQLVDHGVLDHGYSDQMMALANSDSAPVSKVMEFARILPNMADAFNRISTALAGLEMTHGDVRKTADLVREVHADYSQENKPLAMKKISGIPGLNSSTMFMTYRQSMAHLLYGSVKATIQGSYQLARGSKQEGLGHATAVAAKTVAGMVVGNALFAGVYAGAALEPIRLAVWAYHKLFDQEGEAYDLKNSVNKFVEDAAQGAGLSREAGQNLAGGIIPRVMGMDLSTRMGLSDLFFRDMPDLFTNSPDNWKNFAFQESGTMTSFLMNHVTEAVDHYQNAEYGKMLSSMVPIKQYQDGIKAYQLYDTGKMNSLGSQLTAPSGLDAAKQFMGFKPADVADAQEHQRVSMEYRATLKTVRESILKGLINNKPNAEDRRDKWNELHPSERITGSNLMSEERLRQNIENNKPSKDDELNRRQDF